MVFQTDKVISDINFSGAKNGGKFLIIIILLVLIMIFIRNVQSCQRWPPQLNHCQQGEEAEA